MKPKRRVMCPDCNRPKMLFETERKAQDFIRWNAGSMEYGGDTLRAYYCPACCGWHVSHHSHQEHYDRQTENLIGAFKRTSKASSRIDRLIHFDEYSAQQRKLEARAQAIYAKVPEEVKGTGQKTRIKRFLDQYFKDHSIHDRHGDLRAKVYKAFEKDMDGRRGS